MPTYVTVLGWVADGVTALEDAERLSALLDQDQDDTDRTLPEQIQSVIRSMGEVTVWALTTPRPGPEPTLHVVDRTRASQIVYAERTLAGSSRWTEGAPARGWGRIGPTEVASAILSRAPSVPAGLKHRTDFRALVTAPAEERQRILRTGHRIATSRVRGEATRARRKALIEPVAEALARWAPDDPLRPALWDLASFLSAARIREATLAALREGDPTLQDGHIERQRKLLFEALPEAVKGADEAPWVARARSILARYDVA